MTSDTKFDIATHVPEPLRGEAYFKTFEGKPLGEVLKSGLEAHKLVGSAVQIPGPDAKAEDWDKYYAKTRPADVAAYKSPFKPEFATKYAPEAFMKEVFKAAFEVGVNQRQLDHILKSYETTTMTREVNETRDLNLLVETSKAKIKERYGVNYDKAASMASRAAKRFGGDALEKMIVDYHLDADPVFFDAFYKIAEQFTEDTWVGGERKDAAPMTKDQAKAEIARIYADPTHPYNNPQAASHKGAQAEVDRLRKIQFGG
jgi:hypothetical protein